MPELNTKHDVLPIPVARALNLHNDLPPSMQMDIVISNIRAVIEQNSRTDEPPKPLIHEALTSKEITPETVKEASDYYRWLFGNTMHYAVCPQCESEGHNARLTAKQVFGAGEALVSLKQMDSEPLPICPCCKKNEMRHVYDPATITDNFDQKLRQSEESFLSVLRRDDGSLAGLAFAYVTQLERELRLEWGSKYPYMKQELQKPEYQRSRERFLDCVGQIFQTDKLNGGETVLAWNCIGASPDAKKKLMTLVHNLFNSIPEERQDLMVLGDVKKGSIAHRFFRRLSGNDSDSFLEAPDEVLIGGKTREVINALNPCKKLAEKAGLIQPVGSSPAAEEGGNAKDWGKLAEKYDKDVYSITKSPEKRKKIIDAVKTGEKVFIAGCGSEIYLQKDLLSQRDVEITAGDFSEAMLDVSRGKFQHPNLKHMVCDTKNLPFENEFDNVVSTNSIIPPGRNDVVAMYSSIHGALKPNGRFTAFLPSFTLCATMLEQHPELREAYENRMDRKQSRFQDTVGWQCWHTEELIYDELERAGFAKGNISVEVVGCQDDDEAMELSRLYGLEPDMIKKEFSCFLVSAKK